MSDNPKLPSKLGGTRKGAGRKKHRATEENRRVVYDLSGKGTPHVDIAIKLKIHIETLKRYYRDELNLGRIDANALIGGAIFRAAMNGHFGAQKWWSQVRMGWKEIQHIELSSPDGSVSAVQTGKAVLEALNRKYNA